MAYSGFEVWQTLYKSREQFDTGQTLESYNSPPRLKESEGLHAALSIHCEHTCDIFLKWKCISGLTETVVYDN